MRKNENRVQCWIYVCVLLLNNSKWFFRFTDYGKDNVFFKQTRVYFQFLWGVFFHPFSTGGCLETKWQTFVVGFTGGLLSVGLEFGVVWAVLCFQGRHVRKEDDLFNHSIHPTAGSKHNFATVTFGCRTGWSRVLQIAFVAPAVSPDTLPRRQLCWIHPAVKRTEAEIRIG